MGHLFVPAALVLWVVVAVARMSSAPDPVPAPAPAVEVQQPRQVGAPGQSVSEADRLQARVHGES